MRLHATQTHPRKLLLLKLVQAITNIFQEVGWLHESMYADLKKGGKC